MHVQRIIILNKSYRMDLTTDEEFGDTIVYKGSHLTALGLVSSLVVELKPEYNAILAIRNSDERKQMFSKFQRKRRKMLRNRISSIHTQMELCLQEEVTKYEELSEQSHSDSPRKDHSETHRQSEEFDDEQWSAMGISERIKIHWKRFRDSAINGHQFVEHRLRKESREIFAKILLKDRTVPFILTWGQGSSKREVLFRNIIRLELGIIPNSSEDRETMISKVETEGNCFTICLESGNVFLEAPHIQSCEKWFDGITRAVSFWRLSNRTNEPSRSGISLREIFYRTVSCRFEKMKKSNEWNPSHILDVRSLSDRLWHVVQKQKIEWKEWDNLIYAELKRLR
eukprot:379564_1